MSIDQKFLNNCIAEIMADFAPASVSVSVRDGGREFFGCAGKANAEAGTEAGPDAYYAIGSSTKAFTAAALGVLADRKQLDFDEKVVSYLPDFRMYDESLTANLTVRDVLCHRSGLPRHEVSWMLNADYTPRDVVEKMLPYLKPAFPLRCRWVYQNHMYALATVLIEKISGMSFRDFLRENILNPLGMHDTFVFGDEIPDDEPRKSAPYFAAGGAAFRLPYDYLKQLAGAGCLWSTARDMQKWLAFQLHGNAAVLSDKTRLEIRSPQMLIPLDASMPEITAESYGFGWVIDTYRGAAVINHNGSLPGYAAMQIFIPEKDAAVSILMNTASGDALTALSYMLTDGILGLEAIDWPQRLISRSREKDSAFGKDKAGILSLKVSEGIAHGIFEGTYRNPAYGMVSFRVENGVLCLCCTLGVLPLICVGEGRYFLALDQFRAIAPVVFTLNGDGSCAGVDMVLEAMLPNDSIRFDRV